MKVGVDVQTLQTSECDRGIGKVTYKQLLSILKQDFINDYYFFANSDYPQPDLSSFFEYKNWQLFFVDLSKDDIDKIYQEEVFPFVDVFYFPSPLMPNINVSFRKHSGVKIIATVHDIIPFIFKEEYFNNWEKNLQDDYLDRLKGLKELDFIFTDSDSTKNDLLENDFAAADKIGTNYLSIERKGALEIVDINQKYGVDKYIFYVGGGDFRKNIEGLIKEYSLLSKKLQEKYSLVVSCKLDEAQVDQFNRLVENNKITGRVVFTNFVNDDELSILYQNSSLFVFPSLYEGFGLPLVEAISYEIPVLGADNSSIKEIVESKYRFDPLKKDDLAKMIEEILSSPEECRKNVEIHSKKSAVFDWDRNVKNFIDICKKLYEKNLLSQVKKKKKIAFFSPLNPIKSGISDYSENLLMSLKKYFDIDIYINQERLDFKNEDFEIFDYKDFPDENDYLTNLYQMGNNACHDWIYEMLQKVPGAVTLHDYNLMGFVELVYGELEGKPAYQKELNFVKKINPVKNDMTFNEKVLYYSKSVIVHNEWTRINLLNKGINKKLFKIHHGFRPNEELIPRKEIMEKMELPDDAVLLVSVGFASANKRIGVVLNAFSKLLDKYPNFYYLIVGELMDGSIIDKIKDLGISKRVKSTGFVDMKEFDSYIRASDVCVNLRYPTMGETSGALIKILGYGKPAFVTDLNQFSELPDQICRKVPLNSKEEEILTQYIEDFINDDELSSSVGNNAKKYIKENCDWDKVAYEYYRVLSM